MCCIETHTSKHRVQLKLKQYIRFIQIFIKILVFGFDLFVFDTHLHLIYVTLEMLCTQHATLDMHVLCCYIASLSSVALHFSVSN